MRNANDGISLAQTAEGSLGKIGDNLQRMRELAVQSMNSTNGADDRARWTTNSANWRKKSQRVAAGTDFNGAEDPAADAGTADSASR